MSDIIYWVYNNFILPNDFNLKKVVHTKDLYSRKDMNLVRFNIQCRLYVSMLRGENK